MKQTPLLRGGRGRWPGVACWSAMALAAAGLAGITAASAADWPQWRGPWRNGISAETGWKSRWPAGGPKQVWSTQLGQGFSSVAVAGGRLYTMGNRDDRDWVYCLDAKTGKPIWTHNYPCGVGSYGGPRATPTVDGTVVYTLSREGHAVALEAKTGKPIWTRDLRKVAGVQPPQWGFASSPLVVAGRIIYNAGAAGVALDGGGRVVWKSRGDAGYASPVPFNVGGQKGVALFSGFGIVAVNPVDGKELWRYPWQTSFNVNAADPLFVGDTVFISSNYNKGCALVRLSGGRPSVAWQNRSMRNHFNTSVRVGDSLYGNDDSTLRCLDLKTGAERWQMRGMGKGGLIASDGKLIVLTERGELVVIQATPERLTELARAQVLRQGACWTPPVLANGFIYCRSQEGTLVCVDVRPSG